MRNTRRHYASHVKRILSKWALGQQLFVTNDVAPMLSVLLHPQEIHVGSALPRRHPFCQQSVNEVDEVSQTSGCMQGLLEAGQVH